MRVLLQAFFESCRSTAGLSTWAIVLGVLIAGVTGVNAARANPVESRIDLERVQAEEQAQLAQAVGVQPVPNFVTPEPVKPTKSKASVPNSQVSANSSNPIGTPLVSSVPGDLGGSMQDSAPVAAIVKPSLPSLVPSSRYQTEEELIQQMTGQSARPAAPASGQLPVFAPPSSPAAIVPAKPQSPPAAPTTPILVTAGSNSDQPLNLFAPSVDQSQYAQDSSEPRNQPLGEPLPPPGNSIDLLVPSPDSTSPMQERQTGRQAPQRRGLLRSTALTPPSLRFQGVYVNQGSETSARARLTGEYPVTPNILFGATLDLTDGNAFSDSREQGLSINELYLATSLRELPNLRFVIGQLDLTSYFDRNSFAKDGATHFFNPVFQTNPALSNANIASRPGALVNWALTDNLDARAAIFSSSRSLSDFALDGFAGEIGVRVGNAIIRGTYVSTRDGGSDDGFREIFGINRGNNNFGLDEDDREESYGVNAEIFIPNLNMGIFGRYGRYNNRDLDEGGDTYSVGISFLDLFMQNDRLGLAYGRGLSNDQLRRQADDRTPDVLELFYDFQLLPNLRLGFTVQELNGFSETIAGVRVKTEFDVTPRGRLFQ
jgi:hypothetical protein